MAPEKKEPSCSASSLAVLVEEALDLDLEPDLDRLYELEESEDSDEDPEEDEEETKGTIRLLGFLYLSSFDFLESEDRARDGRLSSSTDTPCGSTGEDGITESGFGGTISNCITGIDG